MRLGVDKASSHRMDPHQKSIQEQKFKVCRDMTMLQSTGHHRNSVPFSEKYVVVEENSDMIRLE